MSCNCIAMQQKKETLMRNWQASIMVCPYRWAPVSANLEWRSRENAGEDLDRDGRFFAVDEQWRERKANQGDRSQHHNTLHAREHAVHGNPAVCGGDGIPYCHYQKHSKALHGLFAAKRLRCWDNARGIKDQMAKASCGSYVHVRGRWWATQPALEHCIHVTCW